jgi:hypothetical protein
MIIFKLSFNNKIDYIINIDADTIFELLEKMDQEINQVEKDIEQLDCEYEEMLLEQGIELYDRSMEGDLFKFINDGPEALKEYLELLNK